MKAISKIQEFCKALLKTDSKISSNRFLGVFVFTPVLIIAIFTGVDTEALYIVSGLITALLIGNAIAKHQKFKANNDDLG